MNDDWVIENLRVTLFSPKHKERVIIQNNRDDLRITSRESDASIRQEGPDKATADKKAARKDEPATEATAARAASPGPAVAAANSAPQAPPAPREAQERKSSSLKWQPTEDAGYTGFSAESRDGEFVLLKTERSLWALYFSWGRGVHVGLGCFRELKDGKAAAQKQHDGGPLARPNGSITPEMVEKACPAPPEPEPPAEPAAPEPAAAPPTATPPGDTSPKPPRRARAKKSAAEAEPAQAPEGPRPENEAPRAEDIEINPDEAKRMLGQLKGLLDQES